MREIQFVILFSLALILNGCGELHSIQSSIGNENPISCKLNTSNNSIFNLGSEILSQSQKTPLELNFELIESIKSAYAHGIQIIEFNIPTQEYGDLLAISDKIKKKGESYIISGSFAMEDSGYFSFAIRDNVFIGSYNYLFHTYQINPSSMGISALSSSSNLQIDHQCGEELHHIDDHSIIESSSPINLQENVTVDLLIAYTTGAKDEYGGESATLALVDLLEENMNGDLERSGVPHRVRLVGSKETDGSGSPDLLDDIKALESPNDGRWDDLHDEAKRLGADQIALLVSKGSSGAVGYANGPNARSGYYAAIRINTGSGIVVSHELGHNYGAKHEDGYESAEGKFSTIMSYSSYRKARYFSSIDVKKDGYDTGNENFNSVAKILRYMPQAAEFRESIQSPNPSPTPTPAPSPSPSPTPSPSPSPNPPQDNPDSPDEGICKN